MAILVPTQSTLGTVAGLSASRLLGTVIDPPFNTVAPALDNLSPGVGDTINCSTGTWTGTLPIIYTYQWFQYPATVLLGQTASSYTIQPGDIGARFFCRVTATNGAGGVFADSDVTDVIGGTDPLAALTFTLRLQASLGFGATPDAPYSLFQDATGFVPAINDGDPIGCWRDLLSGSGIKFTQSNTMKQPVLRIVGGKPVVRGGPGINLVVSPPVQIVVDNWSMFSGAYTRTGGRVHFINGDTFGYGQTADGAVPGMGMLYGSVAWNTDGVPQLNVWVNQSSIRTSGTMVNYANGVSTGTYMNNPTLPDATSTLLGDSGTSEDVDLVAAFLADTPFGGSDQALIEGFIDTLHP